MQQNNNKGPKRPSVASYESKQRQPQQVRRTPQQKQTVGQRQAMNQSSRQAMSMAHRREPTIQERAEQHRLENMQREHADEAVRRPKKATPKAPKKKKNKQKKAKGKSLFAQFLAKMKATHGSPDFLIFDIAVLLVAIGVIMVFSASSYRSLLENGNAYSYFIRQLAYGVMGVFAMLFIMNISPEWFRRIAPAALCVVTVLVIYTIFNGEESLGATRWVTIAGIRFTPSEFAKPLMVICTADLIKNSVYDVKKDRGNIMIFAVMLIALLAIASEDLGSALAIFGGCFSMFIVAGLSKKGMLAVVGAGLLGVVAACIQEPYRLQRILGFLSQTEADAASGSAYQLVQSLYAFGSGGLFGVGLGNSGQKLLYLPGMHTDFIYSVIGEELGIIGALLVLGLFMAFAWRGFWIAAHIEDSYKSYLAFGCTSIIIVQALINMGVAVGVLPVTGITLPFISYGGTSLVITLIIVGILLNMSRFVAKDKPRKNRNHSTQQ